MALTRVLTSFIFLMISVQGFAQANRYMVFFKDKAGTPYAITDPSQFLSEKAITRRISQGLNVTELDLPVNPAYVQNVKQTGVEIYFTSRWYNGVLVQCDPALVPAIKALAEVDSVELVAPGSKLAPNGGGRKRFNLNKQKNTQQDVTELQLSMIGINYMHQAGLQGEGMTIAVLDAGFQGVNVTEPFKHLFTEGKFDQALSYDFVYNTTNVFQYDDHGTEVLSVIAAQIPDAFTPGAPNAKFQLYVTEDGTSEYRIEEYNWTFAAERADSAGADIISSSLGYYDFDNTSMNYSKSQMDGVTAVSTKAAQWAAERGMVVVVSAGNEGNIAWKIITAPADAKDVIAVANVDATGKRSISSSTGPSADGRIKPDLAALGTGVKTIKSNGTQGSNSGTSLATPLITSLVAGVWQQYPHLTNLEVIELLKSTASQASNPDNLLGYGIPNFKAVITYVEENNFEQNELFTVFPNPVTAYDTNHTNLVTLRPKDPNLVSSCYVELVSAIGQTIAAENVNFDWLKREYTTDFTALVPGVYFIRVSFENKKYVFKIFRV
jgi:serine protease AprX